MHKESVRIRGPKQHALTQMAVHHNNPMYANSRQQQLHGRESDRGSDRAKEKEEKQIADSPK